MTILNLRVNGEPVTDEVDPRTHLADYLRETRNLTGTHLGCEHGVCGACTILLDGRPVRSCITYAAGCSGAEVRTVEGFDDDPVMAALRSAFKAHHGLQCGYCTPGFLATGYDIVTRIPDASEARIREELAGNLCRCTGYAGIVRAIRSVIVGGVPEPTIRPVERPAPAAAAPRTAPAPGPHAARPPERPAAAALPPVPERIQDPVTLQRTVEVAVAPDRLWAVLRDIDTVALCLPGASLHDQAEDGTVTGDIAVSIGPMKARFAGRARVSYDDDARSGRVIGAGGDRISRSRAESEITFAAEPGEDAARSVLSIDIGYRLSGPLSQFGRPGVVSDIVDRLLEQFAANLARAAEGGEVDGSQAIGGVGYALGTLSALLRRLFRRGT